MALTNTGVGLIELVNSGAEQLNFFKDYQDEKSKKLMSAIDNINKNEKKVFFASNGINQTWKMQRKLKSPAYTTKWTDIPLISL